MKRIMTMVALAICSLTTVWAQGSMSGSGTESDPYKIYYPDQLHQVRNYLNQSGVYFKLMNNIDITEWNEANNPGQGWEPIGVQSAPFKGVFDGNGKKITGFSITRSSTDYVGFFGYINGATIKNLTIEGPVTGHNYVGAFVGYGTGNCTLTNLTHNGAITAYSYAGHIIGQYSGSINSAIATGNISCTNGYAGGIVGYQTTSGKTISNVEMTGDITVSSSSAQYIGGIVGNSNATISNATYSGNVISSGDKVGGISGSSSSVSNAIVTGSVKGKDHVGGICGYSSSISDARHSGNVDGSSYVGGICGESTSTIAYCFSYGDVTGTGSYVGGVVGLGINSVTHSASFGNVSGESHVGGVIGCFGHSSGTEIPEFQFVYWKGGQYTSPKDISDNIDTTSSDKAIQNCYAVGNVTSTNNYAGGICGYNAVSVQWNKANKRTLNLASSDYSNYVIKKGIKNSQVGGKYECYDYTAVVSSLTVCDNYFSGILQGKDYVGGIVGYGRAITITRNYSNATITGAAYVGGIIGDIQSGQGVVQYYPYNSSTPTSPSSTATTSVLKSNMAINSAVIATSNAGRIYGRKGANGVTVGVNSNAAEDNRALYEGRLVISGVTQELVDNEQSGVNNGVGYFKLKANYVAHGWDFNDNWKNLETESFPYKPWQAAPPTISSNLMSGETSVSGNSVDGGTVYVGVGNNAEASATCSGTAWTITGLPALTSGTNVSFYTKVSGKENSYRSQTTVDFPGSGTEADPWRVYTAEDLQGVYKPGYYKQMNDINLASWISANSSTKGWVPVGYNGTDPIVYDGDNHKVTGLWVNSTDDYSGLFSNFSKGTIRNLTVQATAKQVKGGNNVGIVIGKIGQGTIENVTATGNVSAKGNVGGIAGYTNGTTLKNLSYTGQLTATGAVGGITSYATTADVTECEVKEATIKGTGSSYVGGLVAYSLAPISKCNVSGTITLTGSSNTIDVGGLVGVSTKNITDCSVSGAITLTGTSDEVYVGGLAGEVSNSIITKCSTDMTISSASSRGQAAGLIAHGSSTMTIKLCFAAGSVTSTGSDSYTGGLVAYTSSTTTIEDSYSTANVTGTKWTAGLVAYNYGTVNRCYASGNVSSVYYGAGLVGENNGSSAITTNSVALGTKVEISDQTGWGLRVVGNFKNGAPEPDMENLFAWQGMQVSVNGVPKSIPDNNLDGTAITIAQTKNSDTYESLNWDFDEVWVMPADGYPFLNGVPVGSGDPSIDLSGSGTEADPWRVYTAEDLQSVCTPGYYKQMNDIDLASWISANSSTKGWVPVGYNGTDPIVYDGDNYKVTGLWINSTDDYSGLFSIFSKGTIRNLTVQATAKQVKGGSYVGIVIGGIGQGTIENVTATGNVSADSYVGGIAGYTNGTTLKNLSYTGQLTATGAVGGITSCATTADVTECEVKDATINATGSTRVGGLVGDSSAPISKCNVSGTITVTVSSDNTFVGGLVGLNKNTITDCSVSGTITQTGTNNSVCVGGLAGNVTSKSIITKCSTDVTISSASASSKVAGLIALGRGTIQLCCAAGSVTSTGSDSYTGGLVAYTSSATTIEDCYSTANVTGTKWTAGLVAYNYGTVNRCYASGNVSSVYYGAGLVGENDGSSAITTNSVALGKKVEISDQTGWGFRVVGNLNNDAPEPDMENLFAWQGMQVSVNGVPKSILDNNLDGTAITTAQTKNSDTYESLNWDFDEVWVMPANGYPYLNGVPVGSGDPGDDPSGGISGDLSGDGKVNGTDLVIQTNLILSGEYNPVADLNNDGKVNGTDYVLMVNVILDVASARAMTATTANRGAALSIEDFSIRAGETKEMLVSLTNPDTDLTLLQFDLRLPAGLSIAKEGDDEGVGIAGRTTWKKHSLRSNAVGDVTRILLASNANAVFSGDEGRVVSIRLTADDGFSGGDICLENQLLVAPDAWETAPARYVYTVDGTTSLGGVKAAQSADVYTLTGSKVRRQAMSLNGLPKGVYVVKGRKVVVR